MMLNKYLLGAALVAALLGGAFFFGTAKGREWCEARFERLRQQTQEEIDREADRVTEQTQQLLQERVRLQTRVEGLEDEIERMDNVCRADAGGVRRLNQRWDTP